MLNKTRPGAIASLALLSLTGPGLNHLAQAQPPGWNDPFPPHKVMDNLYYVGTAQLASFLIATPEGHILQASNYESSVPVIKAAVEELGFDFNDIKILISGHAHPDHIEGDDLVKEMTGAEVVVGRLEVPYHEAFEAPGGKQQPIDRIVDDGDTVSLGGTTLTAHVQSGHTKGCLAWSLPLEENGRTYYGFIECSLNGQFLQYVGNEDYPEIASDILATYRRAAEIPAPVPPGRSPAAFRRAAEGRRRRGEAYIPVRKSGPYRNDAWSLLERGSLAPYLAPLYSKSKPDRKFP